MKQLFYFWILWLLMIFGLFFFGSCHALVVADKLYYQGSVGKKVPTEVTLSDSTFTSKN